MVGFGLISGRLMVLVHCTFSFVGLLVWILPSLVDKNKRSFLCSIAI